MGDIYCQDIRFKINRIIVELINLTINDIEKIGIGRSFEDAQEIKTEIDGLKEVYKKKDYREAFNKLLEPELMKYYEKICQLAETLELSTEEGGETDPANYVTVELHYIKLGTAIRGYHHAYVRIKDNKGNTFTIRGGPTKDSRSPISDASTDSSGSGSAVDGNFGNLLIDSGKRAERIENQQPDVPQTFRISGRFDDAKTKLENLKKKINESNIPYLPFSQNSNTFAFSAIELLTGTKPEAAVFSPGAQMSLRLK